MQVGSMVAAGDLPSLVGDHETLRQGTLASQQSTTSTTYGYSDKMIGFESSFPMGATGIYM